MNDKEKAQLVANFYQKLADNNNGFVCGNTECPFPNPTMSGLALKGYIVKPKKEDIKIINIEKPKKEDIKIINIEKLIGSNIDLDYQDYDNDWGHYGPAGSSLLADNSGAMYKNSKIREGFWFYWEGGNCPLPEGLIIQVRTRDDWLSNPTSEYADKNQWNWDNHHLDTDIIAFQVISPANDWNYRLND